MYALRVRDACNILWFTLRISMWFPKFVSACRLLHVIKITIALNCFEYFSLKKWFSLRTKFHINMANDECTDYCNMIALCSFDIIEFYHIFRWLCMGVCVGLRVLCCTCTHTLFVLLQMASRLNVRVTRSVRCLRRSNLIFSVLQVLRTLVEWIYLYITIAVPI